MWTTGQDLRVGKIVHYDSERGFGFVRDTLTLTDSFFHIKEQGSLAGDYQKGEFALMLGGYCDCEPQLGDQLIYASNLNYERGPRATTWVDERDYHQQLMLLRRRGEAAADEMTRVLPFSLVSTPNGHSHEKVGAAL